MHYHTAVELSPAQSFLSKINTRINTRNKRETVMIFTDAIEAYGLGLKKKDLYKAYEKAGSKFRGQLAHIFVMLFEDDDDQAEPVPDFDLIVIGEIECILNQFGSETTFEDY